MFFQQEKQVSRGRGKTRAAASVLSVTTKEKQCLRTVFANSPRREDEENRFGCEFSGCAVWVPCNNVSMYKSIRLPALFACAFVLAAFLLFPRTGFAAEITVTMNGSAFSPRDITINAGDTVRWVNSSGVSQTASADNGSFDSGTVASGQSFAATFYQAGTYRYYSKYYGAAGGIGMSGSITIVPLGSSIGQPVYINTSGGTAAQLQAQAAALLNQLNALKQQLGVNTIAPVSGVTYDSSSCPLIGRSLRLGMSGDDVLRLQQFLARDPSIYPEAILSGYFGVNTQRAVQRWQTKYNIVSSGSPSTTGYGVAGPRTAAAISLLCTTGSYGGVSSGQLTVGGYITVTPISGVAPLSVNVTATINTVKSCGGAIYTLDFGDNTTPQQIPVSSGNCSELSQTYPHVYQYGGTYQIKLSAGSHSTSATVTVTGTPAPQFTPNLPRETFTVTPTSGTTPLTVTFSGTVNSNDAGFCAGGCASTLDFGDGSLTSVNLPASVGGWLNYSVSHTYTQTGGFKATLYQGGAGPQQPIVGSATIIVGTAPSTVPTGYSYSPPSITSSGTDSLTFTASFDLPSTCTGYRLSWGDGTPEEIQNDGGNGCAQTPALKTFQHTYTATGIFTIVVKRGPTLERVDDIALTLSNSQ